MQRNIIMRSQVAQSIRGFLTEEGFLELSEQQEKGTIIKEYEACCHRDRFPVIPGFPPVPADCLMTKSIIPVIESAFRPFGKGRKAVRPLREENSKYRMGELYRTEILSCEDRGDKCFLKLRICKGFRHQIRCHLAWIGRPILNDPLYCGGSCGSAEPGFLALRASGIIF